ncbi:type I restriction endonuclease subunit R, partial [Streptococcus mutans]|nr:type I restriction endonuclease subunit R [Streptococcus mutans]
TLFVDKNLRYHGLIQAFSRTNRILNKEKPFGNIVCFRDLEKATNDALTLYGESHSISVVLEKSYEEYMTGFTDKETGITVKGYQEVCQEILEKFPDPTEITLESEKREFVKLFGEVLKLENVLRNYDEFTPEERLITPGQMQDMRSVYVDIREEAYGNGRTGKNEETGIDLSDIEFEIELLKTDEINLDYIISLISAKAQDNDSKETLKRDISRVIRSSIDMRAKEGLVIGFINETHLEQLKDNQTILEAFYAYGNQKKKKAIEDLAKELTLKGDYRRFINRSIAQGYVSSSGTDINNLMPATSRRKGARERKKHEILAKLQKLVETYTGI